MAYRWVDEHGVVHYGDTIPPQYARNSRQILNSEGSRSGTSMRKSRPRSSPRRRTRRRGRVAQQQHDYFLLSTYTSVKDIESLRDERLAQIETQQSSAQQYVQSLQSRLTSLQSRAQQFKPYSSRPDAPRMPDDLAQELVQTLSEVHVQDQAIAGAGPAGSAGQGAIPVRYRTLRAAESCPALTADTAAFLRGGSAGAKGAEELASHSEAVGGQVRGRYRPSAPVFLRDVRLQRPFTLSSRMMSSSRTLPRGPPLATSGVR